MFNFNKLTNLIVEETFINPVLTYILNSYTMYEFVSLILDPNSKHLVHPRLDVCVVGLLIAKCIKENYDGWVVAFKNQISVLPKEKSAMILKHIDIELKYL